MNQVVTLTSVEEKKTGTNKRGPWALRVFTAAGGSKYQTFDVDLGDKAIGLLTQPAEINYEEEVNGDFTNNVLKSIKAASAEAAASAPTPVAVEDPRRSKDEMRRTEAAIVAASLLPGFPEEQRTIQTLVDVADKVILYFEAGSSAFTQAEESLKF